MLDIRQTKEWVEFMKAKGWRGETLENGDIALIRKLPIIGSIIKIQRPKAWPTFKDMKNLGKHRPLFIKLEPSVNLPEPPKGIEFTIDTWPLIPTNTIHINLRKETADFLKSLSKDARQSVKKSKADVKLFKGDTGSAESALNRFYKGYAALGKEKGFYAMPLKDMRNLARAFKDKFYLFEALYKGDTVGGAVVLRSNKNTFFYMHAFTDADKGRKHLAGYKLMEQIFEALKKEGGELLDLEGIYDKRFPSETERWLSFTTFKKKWGGEEVLLPPPFIIHYNKLLGLIFRLGTMGENYILNTKKGVENNIYYQYYRSRAEGKKKDA